MLAQRSPYERVLHSLNEGRAFLKRGIDLDEQFADDNRLQKIRACELYKKGIDCFRAAMAVNIMDVQAEKRAEVKDIKERAQNNLRAAEERFIFLTNKYLSEQTSTSTSTTMMTTTTDGPVGAASTSTASARAAPRLQVRGGCKRTATSEFAYVRKSARPRTPTQKVLRHAQLEPTSPRTPATKTARAVTPSSTTAKSGLTKAQMLKGVDAKFGEALLEELLFNTNVTLDDVYGCESAKQALEEAVIYPALNPSLFSGLRQPVKGILLFGPPGNGKTLLARAVANESKQAFFNITASSLTSKWVGESEKTVKALFRIARNSQPCIIFVDEIDSILCERSEKDSDSSRRLKTEFLIQFDGAATSETDRILVIGATNRPHELDDAILRRFPKRILLDLPNSTTRKLIIENTLRKHNADNELRDSDIGYIASRTEGYSNADLVALCREAAMLPVRQLSKQQLKTAKESKLRALRAADFDEALRAIRPSTNPRQLLKMQEFARQTGQS